MRGAAADPLSCPATSTSWTDRGASWGLACGHLRLDWQHQLCDNFVRVDLPRTHITEDFMRTIIALLCAVSCAAVLVGGCSTPSSGPDIPAGPEFRDRTSPENVLYNLELAYEEMNLEEYLDCLSEDFEFFPCEDDVNNPDLDIPAVWWKGDERTMHENMFTGPDAVESIRLTLTNIVMEHHEGDPHDPLDDTYVFIEGVDLLVNLYGNLSYLATTPSEFRLRVDQDEEGPYGETMWEIDSWFDLDVTGRSDESGRTEDSSWGGIKALFR